MRSLIFSVLCTVLLLGTIASAWQPYGMILGNGMLDRRADSTDASTSEATSTDSASQTSASEASTDTASASDATTTGTASKSESKTDSKSDSKTTSTSSISIDPAAGDGGISMLTPASTSTTYYKIGQDVTFVWNYTSLSVTPTAVDVVATCSLNSATYTLTQNMSVEATGSVVWDTGKYQASATIPLLTATYTLFVYDASKSLTDTASAGYLSSNIGYSFGMYIPQSYTPLNKFSCATCNGAISEVQRQGIKFAVGMAAITVFSFTWFAGTFGLFSL